MLKGVTNYMSFPWSDLGEKQFNSIVNSTSRINLWHGAVRSSKTIMSIVRWLDYVKTGPPGKLLMIGKTERTLKRNILDPIYEMVGDTNYKTKQGAIELFGREIEIVGANDERSEGKIRGITLAGAYGDEITLWPESFFVMLMSRLSVKGAKFFGTTNPDSPYHWLKENYIDNPDLNMASFPFTIDDNPALDEEYVKEIKKEYTGLWYKRFILGLWVLAEGVIYDMFNDEKHVIEEPTEEMNFEKYYIAVDYGTNNPCVFLMIGVKDGKYYVIDEYYYDSKKEGRQKTDSEYCQDMKQFMGDRTISGVIIDPSALSFINELKRNLGVTPSLIMEADNSVLDGIRDVSKALSNDFLFVYKSCRQTLREFSAYVWDEKAQKKGEDKPMKTNDHAMDALRYFTRTVAQLPVYEIY